jgi:hypothetical protein
MEISNADATETVEITLGLREYEEYARIGEACGMSVEELFNKGVHGEIRARYGRPDAERRRTAQVMPFERRKDTNQ